jgi:hypothetical protein
LTFARAVLLPAMFFDVCKPRTDPRTPTPVMPTAD